MTLNHRDGALKWWAAGMSVVPVVADGSKRPLGTWKNYQTTRATVEQVGQWFKVAPEQGVGIICGKVSSNLEMLEIEANRMGSEYLDKVVQALEDQGIYHTWTWLMDTGYVETTPSGGIHILYRIEDQDVPGNTKIALDLTGKITYAETRGEGGFVVVAPSGGTVHKSGESWTCIAGEIGTVPTITWDERCKIHEALRVALDERVLPTYERPTGTQEYVGHGTRPGDAYNADPSVNVYDILTRNGWKYLGKMAGQDRYVHPLSSDMTTHSACTGYKGSENLYAWSGLPKEDFYDKFSLLAHLEFNGDFSAAGKYLAAQGYGDKSERLDISDWFEAEGTSAALEGPTTEISKPANPKIEQFSEKGIGRFAGQVLRNRVRYVSQEKAWRVYGNGVWIRDHEQHVPRMVGKVSDMVDRQVGDIFDKAKAAFDSGDAEGKERLDEAKKLKTFAKGIASNRGIKAVAEIASATEGVGVSAHVFDSNLNLLALENGTFDLGSMILSEHRPENMLTKRIPIKFDETAVASRWVQYLEEVIPDPEYREYLQRAVGMALLGDTSEAAFFVLWGETGCGKSQFIDVITAVFGEYGVTAAASAFRESRNGDDSRKSNSLHALRGARVVMTSETSKHSTLDGELVKRVTGGDSVKSHALYETEIEWKPVFTMFMATNFKPVLDAGDGAIWRRVKPIEFPMSFFRDGQATENREKGLAQKIIATELAGVFNWVLEGVRAYREMGLKDPSSMNAALKSYREDSDPVISFLNEAFEENLLVKEEEAASTMTELYRVFFEWSKQNGVLRPLGKSRFGQRLDDLGFRTHRGTGGVRYRKGLKVGPNVWLGTAQGGGR